MHLLAGETPILLYPLKFSVSLLGPLKQYFVAIGIFFFPNCAVISWAGGICNHRS